MIDYREEVECAVSYWREAMPQEIAELVDKANSDLYGGPTYYDDDGDECTCFDVGAKAFDFKAACRTIGDWTGQIHDVSVTCYAEDDDGEEIEFEERLDDSAQEIIRALVGRELARHV